MAEIDQKIAEKRKELAKLKKEVSALREAQVKNIQILRDTVTVEEAHEIYKRGKVTLEEYKEYVRNRENLEYMVKIGMDHLSPDPVVKRLEEELKELETERKKDSMKLFVKSVLFVTALFLIVPVLAIAYGLQRIGVLPADLVPYIIFFAFGANIVIWIWAYVWGKKGK